MKKIFLFTALLCLGCSSIYAEKTVTKFYGSRASHNSNNPCSGATTRICGTIEQELEIQPEGWVKVETVVKDENGNVIITTTKKGDRSIQEIKEELILKNSAQQITEFK